MQETFLDFYREKFFLKILFIHSREKEGESTSRGMGGGRGRSKLPTEQGAQHGARSQDPWIMT